MLVALAVLLLAVIECWLHLPLSHHPAPTSLLSVPKHISDELRFTALLAYPMHHVRSLADPTTASNPPGGQLSKVHHLQLQMTL